MSSVTTPSALTPAPNPGGLPRSIPSVDELLRLTSEPDERIVFRDVDWAFYEQLVDSLPEGVHIHIDYDGKDLEIMSPGLVHEDARGLMGRLVEVVSEELEIPCKSAGQTTWKRPEVARGLESDECYFFRADKLTAVAQAKARKSRKIADYPNPDLAIEVDVSRSKIDRPGIYAALKVPEVWRFDGEQGRVIIERLKVDGTYEPVEESMFVPIRAEEIRRWIVDEDSHDESAWARRLRAWVRAELVLRRPG